MSPSLQEMLLDAVEHFCSQLDRFGGPDQFERQRIAVSSVNERKAVRARVHVDPRIELVSVAFIEFLEL